MEYNDLDGYERAILYNEKAREAYKHYENAAAYASIKDVPALTKEFSKIKEIVCKEFDKAETNWHSLLWQLSEKGIGKGLRQLLEESNIMVEDEYKQAGIALKFYNSAFSKLLTMAERKDFSGDDDGCYISDAA